MSLVLIFALAEVVRPITAQENASPAGVQPRLVAGQTPLLAAEELGGMRRAPQRASSRDSVKNGAITGAIVGAVSLGALGAFICHLYQEDGGASCLPDTLRSAAIGAAVGAGAGVAVDAALTRHGGVTLRVGVRF